MYGFAQLVFAVLFIVFLFLYWPVAVFIGIIMFVSMIQNNARLKREHDKEELKELKALRRQMANDGRQNRNRDED